MSRAVVLMYHQVDVNLSSQELRFCTPPGEFEKQVRWLIDAGYRGVSMDDVLSHVTGKEILPEKSVHVTFDDGFVGVLEHALPALKTQEMPATLFVLSDLVGQTNAWMSARGFPRRALLSKQQLRLLAEEGITIGSHTCTHVPLPDVARDLAAGEISASKSQLEDLLGREVAHFAYPYGRFNEEVRDMVIGAGYRSACSTRCGFNRTGEDPFLLRRIDISGTDRLWQFRQKVHHGINRATYLQPVSYYAGRAAKRLGFR